MVVDTAVYTLHTAFAAVWAGAVLFVVAAVHPLAMDGDIAPDAYGRVVSTLQGVTRASAVVLFVTGGYMAGVDYGLGELTTTTRGYLVLAMLGLWLLLAATVEVACARAIRGTDRRKIRAPAREPRPLFLVAVVLTVGLLVVAGLVGRPPAGL
ncbi:transporter [Halobacteriales archaeon SW_12_69_24]|nr:MAG: transporter [Halobacteriales archaeon SW_12_69_24]